MTGWENTTLGCVCRSVSETYHGQDSNVVLVNTSDVFEGEILAHEYVPNVKLRGQFKKTFQKDDILFSEIRPANKRYAYVTLDDTRAYIASTKLMVLRANREKIIPRYLYSFLKSEQILAELQHLAETRSGTFPQITFDAELAPLKIILPAYDTQKKIVDIISVFDDKIALNRKINKNLEEQAQAIFAHLFSDRPYHLGTLSQIADVIMGQSPRGESYNETKSGALFFQGRADFGFRFPTPRLYTTEPKRMAQAGDVLLSVRAPVGDLNIALEPCCIGRGIAAIRSIDGHPSFLFYCLLSQKDQFDVFNGEGTVFGSINSNALKSMEVRIPPKKLLDHFEEMVAPIDTVIRVTSEEILYLTALRDTLLPRLMSGELDVSNIEL